MSIGLIVLATGIAFTGGSTTLHFVPARSDSAAKALTPVVGLGFVVGVLFLVFATGMFAGSAT